MITAAQVRKRYGDAWALYPTDLAVEAGQRVAIVGPSGCGKSTLMRILGGLLSPDGGAVTLEGRPFTIEARLEQRRAVGYVVQDGGLFPHLTAEENVTLVARHLGLAPAARKARLDTLASLVRLGADALARYPKGLSGGERQRVSLMRALFLEPSVLLLDEPFSALDPITRRGLQRELGAIVHTLGKTVVLVTHDLDEAAFLGKELLLMRGGAIVQRGTFADLRDRPRDAWVTEFVNAGAPLCPIEAR